MRILGVFFLVALAGCAASSPPELSGNELARRAWYPGRWPVVCRDLRASYAEAPFLKFVFLAPDRIADLKFTFGPGPRYDEHAIPRDLYGPFHGEEVTDDSSPYSGGNEYVISEQFRLYLPYLTEGFEDVALGRDRDSARQNAAVEVAVAGQRYASIIHLRCIRPQTPVGF